jgi:divalent metal cation (Fe/Co/Zn/Cd) transporter
MIARVTPSRATVDVTVPADLNVVEAHELAHHAEVHPLDQVRRLTAATVHISPTGVHTSYPGVV